MKSESLQRWKLSKAVMWRWFLVWVWISSFIPPEIPMVVLVWAHELRATGADIAHLFMITCQSEKPWSFLRLITMEMKGLNTQLLSEKEIRAATNQNELCQERSTGNYQYCWKNALWSMLSRGLSVHRANVVHGHFSVAVCPWPASLGSKKISGHECAHSVPELRIRESLPALQFIFKKCISRRIVPEAH